MTIQQCCPLQTNEKLALVLFCINMQSSDLLSWSLTAKHEDNATFSVFTVLTLTFTNTK